jgi:hypothetical protein
VLTTEKVVLTACGLSEVKPLSSTDMLQRTECLIVTALVYKPEIFREAMTAIYVYVCVCVFIYI